MLASQIGNIVLPMPYMNQHLAGVMRGRSLEEWIDYLGLELVNDPQIQKQVYRRVNFGPTVFSSEIEESISAQLREQREKFEMTRTVLAPLLGLHHQVLSRYENATSKLTVGRLIHICEILRISPLNMLYPVAPYLFGETQPEAELKKSIMDKLHELDEPTLVAIVNFIQHLKTKKDNFDSGNNKDAAQAAS